MHAALARGSITSPRARPSRRCSCSFTVVIGNATTRTCSPFSPTGRAPTGSKSSAIRWRRRRASLTSSEKFVARSRSFASAAAISASTAIGSSSGRWSAGGRLTAIVSDHPAFRGGVPISGIFDLEPIALNYLNEKLALDAGEIATLSPLRALRDRAPPLRMFVGSEELPELKRQSAIYAEAARQRTLPVTLTVLPDRHPYTIIDELDHPAI